MKNPLDWSLLYGIVPALLTVLGALGLACLAIRWKWRWYTRTLPIVVGSAVVIVVLLQWLVDDVWHPFPDPVPITVVTWSGVTIGTVILGVARLISASWRWRLVSVGAVALVVLMALNHVNTFFGYEPNLRDALGLSFPNQISAADALRLASADPPAGGPTSLAAWKAPRNLPKTGEVVEVDIPGVISHFVARDAWLYLPPAYLVRDRPRLPVLELFGGQPGTPRDWLDGGNLVQVMDQFANRHQGLAPVVVMPDPLGSFFNNPLCMNSRLGQSDTYLAVDVPNWVRSHLVVDDDTQTWSVVGASFGGTCAWQLAVLHPQLFPTFIDISGVFQQAAGTLQETIQAAFGGNSRKFAEVNPAQILQHHTRRNTWAIFAVGSNDTYYRENQERAAALSRHAGMHVRWLALRGGHSFAFFSVILADSMNWLAQREGIPA